MKVWWSSLCELLCLNTIILLLVCLVCDSCVHLANCQCVTCTTFLFPLPYTFFKSTLFSSPFQILFYTLSSGGVAVDVSNLQISINLQRPANSVRCVLKKTENKWQGGLGEKQRMTGRREGVKQEIWQLSLHSNWPAGSTQGSPHSREGEREVEHEIAEKQNRDFKTQEFKTVKSWIV